MRAIRGRKRPRTRNQIGNVVITLFSIYVRRITEESEVVKCVFIFWWIFIFSYATLLQCGARMAACSMSVQDDSRMAFYGPTSRKVLVACRVLLQRHLTKLWNTCVKWRSISKFTFFCRLFKFFTTKILRINTRGFHKWRIVEVPTSTPIGAYCFRGNGGSPVHLTILWRKIEIPPLIPFQEPTDFQSVMSLTHLIFHCQ